MATSTPNHPQGMTDKEWFANLPDPNGEGRISMRAVRDYVQAKHDWLMQVLGGTQRAQKSGAAVTACPEINLTIEDTLDIAASNARRLAVTQNQRLSREDAIRQIETDFDRLPTRIKELMPFAELVRRLYQPIGGQEIQLDRASQLTGGGILAGLTVEGDPFSADIIPGMVGLPYGKVQRRTSDAGCCLVPRGLPGLLGTEPKTSEGGKSYVERMIEAALGEGISPVISAAGSIENFPTHMGIFLDSGDNKKATVRVGDNSEEVDRGSINQYFGAIRIYTIRDLERETAGR